MRLLNSPEMSIACICTYSQYLLTSSYMCQSVYLYSAKSQQMSSQLQWYSPIQANYCNHNPIKSNYLNSKLVQFINAKLIQKTISKLRKPTDCTETSLQSNLPSLFACFEASGPGHLAVIEAIMNSSVYKRKYEAIDLTAKAKLGPKHSSKSTTECLKKKTKKKVFQ